METINNRELQSAWDFVENTGHSIFLTGKAGAGKTTFLKKVVETSRKRIIVVQDQPVWRLSMPEELRYTHSSSYLSHPLFLMPR